MNATGDEFFVSDSSQYYSDALQGESYLRYVPNTNHGLNAEATANLEAFYEAILNGTPRPQFDWTLEADGSIRVETVTAPSQVLLWQATNATERNFRLDTIGAAWTSSVLTDQGGGVYIGSVAEPTEGWTAFFVELTFPSGGLSPFKFTTDVRVTPDTAPYRDPGGWGTIETAGTGDDAISVVRVGGDRYQMGYWYGRLLADQIAPCWTGLKAALGATEADYDAAIAAMWQSSYFDTTDWELELRGIADGCIDGGHPEMTYRELQKMLMIADLSEVTCGLFGIWGDATIDNHLYQMRNLDWSMDTGAQDYPVVAIYYPDDGEQHAVIGFAGLTGAAVGGMNIHGVAVSQIMGGFGDTETLDGIPFPILLRDALYHDTTLADALSRVQNAARTCEYYYCISGPDGVGDPDARLLFTSSTRYEAYSGGESIVHPYYAPFYTPFPDVVYWKRHDGGAYAMPGPEDDRKGNQTLYAAIDARYGTIDAQKAIEIAVADGVASTLVSIVYDTTAKKCYIAFAEGSSIPAQDRTYVEVDITEGPGIRGFSYLTSVGSGAEEIPTVVVSGTPFEMGYHYGLRMQSEIQAFIPTFLAYVQQDQATYSNAILDAAWADSHPYTDDRYEQELLGLAAGSGVDYLTLRRVHCTAMVDTYSCSSVAAWDTATADGHLYQTRDLDWDMGAGAHDYPALVLYLPESGIAHANVSFAGLSGSHTGISAKGIALSEMGDSPGTEKPYDLNGTHFMPLFRQIMYDADNLTDAVDILTNAQRIKRYHYVFGDGQTELDAVKILAHAPETPPNDLVIWTDNDSTDEFAPNVLVDVVYNDEGRGAYPTLVAEHGVLDATKMVNLANSIATAGSNVMNVVYDATDLELWTAFAEGAAEASSQPYVYVDLKGFDSDGDGIGDIVEGGIDTDLNGTPNFQDTDSDGDGINDSVEGDIDSDGDGDDDYVDLDADGDTIDDSFEGTSDVDSDLIPNYLDLDSDNDGYLDVDEWHVSDPYDPYDPDMPTVTLTSPVGDETWLAGTGQDITWTSTGYVPDVRIRLIKGGVPQDFIIRDTADDGHVRWNIPAGLTSGSDYSVRIFTYTGSVYISDESGPFTISEPKSITVTAPNGGNTLTAGEQSAITWDSTGSVGPVSIRLIKGGVPQDFIIKNTANDGSVVWNVPAGLAVADDYRIRIFHYDGAQYISDDSDGDFSVAEQRTLTITTPNGGQSWQRGTTHEITWNSTGTVGPVRLRLFKGGVPQDFIVKDTGNDGSYWWNISGSLVGDSDYTVRIFHWDGVRFIYDDSDGPFTITE
jgi:hypothetical protein